MDCARQQQQRATPIDGFPLAGSEPPATESHTQTAPVESAPELQDLLRQMEEAVATGDAAFFDQHVSSRRRLSWDRS